MRSSHFLIWTVNVLLWHVSSACTSFQLQSTSLGHRPFTALPDDLSRQSGLDSGRSSYVTSDSYQKLFLYHVIENGGTGRWIVSDTLGDQQSAVAFVNSWAIMPTLIHSLDGGRKYVPWQVHDGSNWVSEQGTVFSCLATEAESAVYLEVQGDLWAYSGFFVESGDKPIGQVYSMVANSVRRYLYKSEGVWILSGVIGSTMGEAYVEDPAEFPAEITNTMWYFGNGTDWKPTEARVIAGDSQEHVLRKLHMHRRLASLPPDQKFFELANGMALPAIGLGTGGLPKKTSTSVIRSALRHGYRLLDLAREYQNEGRVERVLSAGRMDSEIPLRSEVFLVSKVWPTQLGFHPTTKAIYESLRALQTPYIDMFMLHWPVCNPKDEAMHCDTSEEPMATWHESWHALERAYSEGLISSMGVSNFPRNLLEEFKGFGGVLPHAVQNSAQPGEGRGDMPVREWCSLHGAVFMPYSTQSKLKSQSKAVRDVVEGAASRLSVSPNAVVSRFFHQSGAAVIPRSSKISHLKENLNIHSFVLTGAEMKALGWPHEKQNSDEL